MAGRIGGGRIASTICVTDPDQLSSWIATVSSVVNRLIDGGGSDTKFAETMGGTAGEWNVKVQNSSTYNAVAHQLGFWQIDTDGTLILFTDKGVGAGDNYTLKIDAGGTPGYLEAIVNAATWQGASTYNSSLHFVVLAGNDSDSAILYAPWNIIKNSAGDSANDFLFAKFADQTTTPFDADENLLALFYDNGSTISAWVSANSIITVISAQAGPVKAIFSHISPGGSANTSGGLVVYGMNASNGQPLSAMPLTGDFVVWNHTLTDAYTQSPAMFIGIDEDGAVHYAITEADVVEWLKNQSGYDVDSFGQAFIQKLGVFSWSRGACDE